MKKLFTLSAVVAMLAASLSMAQAGIINIAAWNFENDAIAAYVPNPAPSTALTAATASSIGMAAYTTGTNDPDVLAGAVSDTGGNLITNVTHTWRVRGQKTGNGWSSTAPIGVQGAQFNVDTTGFTLPINVTFDWYVTGSGEAHMQLQYTTNNWTTSSNILITIPVAEQTSLQNSNNTSGADANTVAGYYVSDNALVSGVVAGQDWFTNLTASITDPNAANNPNFGIRIVNASTGAACLAASGAAFGTSGNWRFDNISVSGTAPTGPTLNPASNITADSNSFAITYTATPAWSSKITSITVGSYSLPLNPTTTNSTSITFNMADVAAGNLFRTNASVTILVVATGYAADSAIQPIAPGAPTTWNITQQPAGPTGNGGTLITNPVVSMQDQWGNTATTASGSVTASPAGGTWAFGSGSGTTVPIVNGAATFTNLSATSAANVSAAYISLNGALGTLTTTSFNLPAPATSGFGATNLAVFQEDVVAKNSTFSILEVNPVSSSVVQTIPIPATGPNALRMSSAATTGRMSDSADGTLVCFTGFETQDGSLVTTPDVTSVNPRGVGTLNGGGTFALQTSYTGDGQVSANQTRSATTLDNQTWYIGDKGGVYTNNTGNAPVIATAGNNVRSMKAFDGLVYFMQQASGKVVQTPISYVNGGSYVPLSGFNEESNCLDFYMVQSGANGSTYDTLYYIDGTKADGVGANGGIFKYYFTGTYDGISGAPVWAQASGSPQISANLSGDGLCARTNAAGGIDLYFTTGTGGVAGNSLVTVHDSGATNVFSLGAVTTNYTASANATLKGVALAPIALVTNIALSASASSVVVGSTTNLVALVQILPANAANQVVIWNSDNTSAATVNGSGVVTGVGVGTAHISATTTDGTSLSATNLVTVTSATVSVTGIALSASASTLIVGGSSTTIYDIITPANATTQTVIWHNDNPGVVSTNVDSTGTNCTLTPVTAGTAHVWATTTDGSNLSATNLVTVNTAPASQLTGAAQLGGGKFKFAFTNLTGLSFSVLATNNLAVPKASWPVVGTAVEYPAGSGNYQYTNPSATGTNKFYMIRQP